MGDEAEEDLDWVCCSGDGYGNEECFGIGAEIDANVDNCSEILPPTDFRLVTP